ncbi:MAG: ribonuclease P protein component [Verrucomicrobia bacterium]|nr:ribonuclease P protein component [Verrucomicrobiota bacterium]
MNQCLPKRLRIRQSDEIRQILTAGRKYTGNHIILYRLPAATSQSPIRAGFLSPKRIGKAVKRNRVRRWMREAFRRHRAEMVGADQILLMGRTSAINAGYQALHNDFLQLCRKARLLPLRDP